MGVLRIVIRQEGVKVLARVFYSDRTEREIMWNNSEERKAVLDIVDGYTFIEDTRL